MSETSEMSPPVTCVGSLSVTGSLESAAGPTPCVSPVGPMTGPHGPAVALVNLSARQARELGLLTSGTSGQPGSTSSAPVALQSFSENRSQVPSR